MTRRGTARPGRHPWDVLTPTETTVLEGLAAGEMCGDTALRLNLSPWTIRWNRKKVLRKLGVRTAGHAVAVAYERGILGKEST